MVVPGVETMKPETEAKILTVQRFGRYARAICGCLGVLLPIYMIYIWGVILAGPWIRADGPMIGFGAYYVTGTQLISMPIKAWALIVFTTGVVVSACTLYQLYCLFDRLADGAIYTKQTVWHLRQLGWLAIVATVVHLILPPISLLLVDTGFIDRALVTFVDPDLGTRPWFSASLGGFATGLLILLASWILDVARQTAEDAEAMRREAELVI